MLSGASGQTTGAPGFIAESSPPYEGVEEFKVQNSLYPGEYGLGYGVLNFTLKSGTNRFHGNLFEYHRNTVLNANNFFNNNSLQADGTATPRPKYIQNQFGGSLGGPIYRNNTFFFVDY